MYKVLVVDDQAIIRYDIKRMSVWGEASGFIIADEAENGLEALKKLESSHFDLLITDIRMPVMDGMNLLREVSENELCPCVVLLSDYTEFRYAREALVHGAFDYLTKPPELQNITQLLSRVREFLDKRKNDIKILKNLENLAEEAFLPASDIEKVAILLCKGQDEAIDSAEALVETVGAALDYNVTRMSIILKNALVSVLNRVLKEHDWVELYLSSDELKNISFGDSGDFWDTREKFTGACRSLLDFLKKMVLWNTGNNIVKMACQEVLHNVESGISVKSIAEKLFISKTYLSELFKQVTGTSLLEYITMVKVERGKYLLKTTPLKNYEISERLGFSDHEYFSKIFKKYTGYSPAAYRKNH